MTPATLSETAVSPEAWLEQIANSLRKIASSTGSYTSRIKSSLTLSGQWIAFTSEYPDWLSAIAILKHDLPCLTASAVFRDLALFTLLLNFDNENAHSKKHLIAAVILYDSNLATLPKAKVEAHKKTAYALKTLQLGLIRAAYVTLAQGKLNKHRWRAMQIHKLWFAKALSHQIKQYPNQVFANVLHHLSSKLACHDLKLLDAFIHFPGLVPIGSNVSIAKIPVSIIAHTATSLVHVQTEETHHTGLYDKLKPDVVVKTQLSVEQWHNLLHKVEHFDTDNTRNWQTKPPYPIHRLPTSLRAILSQLNNANVDLNRLAEEFENEPAFKEFMLKSASQANRLKLPVGNIKQGLMTYGLERVGNMLTQFALSERLTQNDFLLQKECRHLLHLGCYIASELAMEIKGVTPQTCALLMTFAMSPLFTIAEIKTQTRLKLSGTRLFSPDSLFDNKNQGEIKATLYELAKAWQQPVPICKLMLQFGHQPHQVTPRLRTAYCVVGQALVWLREWYFNTAPCVETKQFCSQSESYLGNMSSFRRTIRLKISEQLYCPINTF